MTRQEIKELAEDHKALNDAERFDEANISYERAVAQMTSEEVDIFHAEIAA